MGRRLTIFATGTTDGQALANAVAARATSVGFDSIEMPQPSQEAVIEACLGDGALVYDATIEPDGTHLYDAASYALLSFDYNLIVSRTYLPANFLSVRRGVAPPYPATIDIAALLPRIETQLAELCERVPRPPEHVGQQAAKALGEDALARARERRHGQAQAFVSHRGQWAADVEELADQSRERFGIDARVFRTGELAFADELMTFQQRWAVLRELQRWIAVADEFWIFRTDDYARSWWTRGERVLLANMVEKSRPRVIVARPGEGLVGEIDRGDVPSLSKREDDRLLELLYFAHQPEWLERGEVGKRTFRSLTGRQPSGDMFELGFRRDPLLHCSVCIAALEHESGLFDFDIGRYLSSGPGGLHPIPDDTLRGSDRNIACPACGSEYGITAGPPRFWWYPYRDGAGTGPGGVCIEERPSYRSTLLTAQPLTLKRKVGNRLGRFFRAR
jgi:hypothetical protein